MARNDSAGGGFAFDDDADLDKLMAIAAQGEEDEDSNDDDIFLNDSGKIETVDSASPIDRGAKRVDEVPEHRQEPVEEPPAYVEPLAYESPSERLTEPSTAYSEPVESVQEPYRSPSPVSNAETADSTARHSSFGSKKPYIRKESEFIEEASRIIHILDTYRGLSDEVKLVAAQFIYNDNEVEIDDEAKLVVKVFNADEMLSKTMTNLKESASEKDRVRRAFYILRLPDSQLRSLGELVSTLTEKQLPEFRDRIGFSQEVESAVDDLDPKIIEYVAATESVLQAGK